MNIKLAIPTACALAILVFAASCGGGGQSAMYSETPTSQKPAVAPVSTTNPASSQPGLSVAATSVNIQASTSVPASGLTNAQTHFNMGNSHLSVGEVRQAIEEYDKAIDIDPNLSSAYVNKANAYIHLRDHRRAMDSFDMAISVDPNSALAYYNRGTYYDSYEERREAIDDYDNAIRLDPNRGAAYMFRGVSLSRLGQNDEAQAEFERAMELGIDESEIQRIVTALEQYVP